MISPTSEERIVIGYKQVLKSLKSGICKTIFIADDCSPHMTDTILEMSGEISVRKVSSMRELGRECGIDVSASCAAIVRL
ncbi:MAG: ribosomal L7Ae/L30e/S12e/Gadd45 family protein [Synergistaceae bacterium]|nr:ribosomal L7Ae/L30e/S12e/Gadd45 family protein [Synergistaceae bacterium]